jgi:cytochrome c oxidase subunit III
MSEGNLDHLEHFQDLEQQAHAARLGIWVFLASELLLFAGLFALYGAYRAHYPEAFGWGVEHNVRVLGTLNTGILISSSYAVATSVHVLREGRSKVAAGLLAFTLLCGFAFLFVKGIEYSEHFREGVFPGGRDAFFVGQPQGLKVFYTLYFLMTGLHGIHVIVGMCILAWIAVDILRGKLAPPHTYRLDLGAVYWHLIDVIWIFLWPIFYLMPGSVR